MTHPYGRKEKKISSRNFENNKQMPRIEFEMPSLKPPKGTIVICKQANANSSVSPCFFHSL